MSTIRLLLLTTIGLSLSMQGAYAQEEPDEELKPIDLIEVFGEAGYRAKSANSATGLSIAIEDLPVNIQVITADVVSDFQLLSQRDALQFHAAADDKRIRGFNSGEFFRNGFIHLSDTPGYTIERLEIIRGPSAVLNGPVTPGGAVNIITKSPEIDEDFGEIGTFWGFSGDDRDNRGYNVDFNLGSIGPTGEHGSLGAFRFVGGFQEDTGFGTRANNESSAILPMLELRPSEDTVINLEYYQYRINTDRTDRPMGIELTIPGATPGEEVPLAVAYGIDPRTSWFGEDTDIEESVNDYSVSLAHQFTDRLLGQIDYSRHNRDFVFGPGNRPRIDIFYRMVADAAAPPDSSNPDDYSLRRLTENLSLENNIDQATASLAWLPDWGNGEHQLVGGVHLYDQNALLEIQRPRPASDLGTFYFDFFDPATVASDNLSFNQAGESIVWATVLKRIETVELNNVFLNYHGNFMDDRLSVLLGLTHSDIKIARGDPRVDPLVITTIADNNELLPQAGFVFDVTDAFSVYANYSESQLPDVNDPDFNTAPPVRIGEQIEFGAKFVLFDEKLDASIAYFKIEEDLSGETSRNAEADGFEIDATFSPIDNLSIVFSYANADTEVTASSDPTQVGDPLVDEVPNKAAFWTVYEFEGGSVDGLSIGGGLVWTDERVRPTAGAAQAVKKLNGEVLRFDAETRLDLFAKYDWNQWQFSLNLRNLTEEVNLSNNVPRVPLQGGVRADGSPYVFDGDMEVMFGVRFAY
ncbi:MAG: TonB-dependent receptor [Pseudomonadota bacterium]